MNESELDHLLEPVSADSACGADLQYEPAYDRIRLARSVKPQQLPAGVWERDERKVNWPDIAKECVALLQHRSKDLQVVAWLCEALVHTHAMDGLRLGLDLMNRLSQKYWDEIHPLPEEGDWSRRLRPFGWLGRELPGWIQAPLRAFNSGATPAHREELVAVLACLRRMQHLLDERLGETEVDINEACVQLQAALSQSNEDTTDAASVQTPTPRQALASRAAAYEQLREIAEFLARHEPHSPVPEILRAIAEWQNWEFGELLSRLPSNGPSVYDLARLFTLSKRAA